MSKRPWQHLPIKPPNKFDPGPEFFYEQIAKPLITDFVRMMCNGLLIDDDKVEELRATLDINLAKVSETLNSNSIIYKFQEQQYKDKYAALETEQRAKFRTLGYYLKSYKQGDMVHRTYLVNYLLDNANLSADKRSKWTVNDLKKYNKINPLPMFQNIIDKTVDIEDKLVIEAMKCLAQEKLDIYNKSKLTKLKKNSPTIDYIRFNKNNKLHRDLYAKLSKI